MNFGSLRLQATANTILPLSQGGSYTSSSLQSLCCRPKPPQHQEQTTGRPVSASPKLRCLPVLEAGSCQTCGQHAGSTGGILAGPSPASRVRQAAAATRVALLWALLRSTLMRTLVATASVAPGGASAGNTMKGVYLVRKSCSSREAGGLSDQSGVVTAGLHERLQQMLGSIALMAEAGQPCFKAGLSVQPDTSQPARVRRPGTCASHPLGRMSVAFLTEGCMHQPAPLSITGEPQQSGGEACVPRGRLLL